VPAVDEAGGPVLSPQGVALPGARGGGIDSGTRDSICREDQVARQRQPRAAPRSRALRRIGPVGARVVSDVTAGGARRRQSARVALRSP
jgi:hypothetical protein